MGLVWGLDLPKPLKFTLLALADHADHDGGNARPSVGLLAWKTGDDRRTIQRHLRDLEALHLIEPASTTRGGLVRSGPGAGLVGKATVYQLTLWNGVKLSPFEPGRVIPSESTRAAPVAEKGDISRGEGRQP